MNVVAAAAVATIGGAYAAARLKVNRSTDALVEPFRSQFLRFLDAAAAAGKPLVVTETLRTPERQAWLYAQGRVRPGPIVTHTMKSNHLKGIAADTWPKGLGYSAAEQATASATFRALEPIAAQFGLKNLEVIDDLDHWEPK